MIPDRRTRIDLARAFAVATAIALAAAAPGGGGPDPVPPPQQAEVKKAAKPPGAIEGFFRSLRGAEAESPAAKKVEAEKTPAVAAPAPKAKAKGKAGAKAKAVPPNVENQARQFLPQFRMVLRSEYTFARAACGLSEEQRERLAREAEVELKGVAVGYVEAQQRGMQMGFDWRAKTRAGLAEALKKVATPEQLARFRAEVEARGVEQRRAVALALVARIDKALTLDGTQREAIGRALIDHWSVSFSPSLESVLNLPEPALPAIPNDLVVPSLDPSQKAIWAASAKSALVPYLVFGNLQDASPLDREDAEGRPLPAKPGVRPRPAVAGGEEVEKAADPSPK